MSNFDVVESDAFIRKIFASLDTDSSGNLTCEEIKSVIPVFFQFSTPEHIQSIFERIDINNDGFIDLREFYILVLQHKRDMSDMHHSHKMILAILLAFLQVDTTSAFQLDSSHIDALRAQSLTEIAILSHPGSEKDDLDLFPMEMFDDLLLTQFSDSGGVVTFQDWLNLITILAEMMTI
eukprot:gnl/Dysnectes_brevis/3941_a5138_821.p1 GENE.gnl/Dysnectes_brevis/3941_a5138_821~~gnl/Dysnectes_brevis/3941_a5138_821.p1  ORF type:complete len:179 (+),score=30.94 gnl/Dysnectes_brevis/3941_a5138_821:152-688(+)